MKKINKKDSNNKDLKEITKFIYELGILAKTPRSGFWFLGTGNQSVAEHICRTVMIGYILSYLTPNSDKDRVMFLSLIHDLGEGRTSDLNYVHQKYGRLAESEAVNDLSINLPFGKEIKNAFNEAKNKMTLEAKLAKDADNLEWIASLLDESKKGNIKANSWARIALKRLKTSAGKKIGKLLFNIEPDSWWFKKDDQWFVDRNKKHLKKKK